MEQCPVEYIAYRKTGLNSALRKPLQIAAKFTNALGREIKHVKLSREDKVRKYMSLGFPEPLSQFMTGLEVRTAEGMEARPDRDFEKVVGEKGQTFDEWIQEHKQVWL